jgi:alkylation response protein AidB-like acyl-CoA dehydrogenase
LKEKLGVRSMATGEITFENAEANLLGGEAAALADTEEELLRAGYSAEG